MKDTLKAGQSVVFEYVVPADKTVPFLYPESQEFQLMPEVFATGFMVGLMEWTCMKVLASHLDEGEGSLGVHIDVSHVAPTLPGQTVRVDATCTEINGRRVSFRVKAHDGIDSVGEGRHERMVVHWDKFKRLANKKAQMAGADSVRQRVIQ